MRTNLLKIFTLFFLLTAVAGTASAKGKRRKNKKANVHFKNGVSLYEEGKYVEALAEFERANEIAPHVLVLYNMGITYRALSKYATAIRVLERFVAEGKGEVGRRQLKRGKEELEQLLSLVARVNIITEPEGARIEVDGNYQGVSPLTEPLVLGPGNHTLRVVLAGYDDTEQPLKIASGDVVEVEVTLLRKPKPANWDDPDEDYFIGSGNTGRIGGTKRFGLAAGFGTNALRITRVGAPLVGASAKVGSRFTLGVDVLLVAYAIVPSVRFRFIDKKRVALDGILAVPVSFATKDDEETFAALSGGLTLRVHLVSRISLRLDAMMAYAGDDRGLTLPLLAATEFWF